MGAEQRKYLGIFMESRPAYQIGNRDEVITEENLRMAYGVDVRVVREGNAVDRKVCFPVIHS